MINRTIQFVKETLCHAESGHDYFHIERVLKMATRIANEESKHKQVNLNLVQLGALLHDIADHKFHGGDDTIGPKVARQFLEKDGEAHEDLIKQVEDIIKEISFKGAKVKDQMSTFEGQIVQDADRLDALGAIGIARCFTYGGYKNRQLYNPDQKPQLHDNFQDYKKNESTTINHFYEKLLLLKDRMNTETGKKIAENRHQIMVNYLDQFLKEWEGID
ncbi:unnamed protein product (macronuclear) [Paramecium tetraurelia]|uniref:HD domain-containing protein n=1 Tax=Paramecium tetraurelia TaxID=5888 RepID=A0BFX1_PARTE|nr:uncharacterized protein GSPATT00028473001 [Paramecium tetraurelia]CAK57438.1 unnamed protein product [Paramecium tetraurelia]|eukprot:XP_001424836.1 hypothetical protein (macronuclear) [Paramecium tetraurelia strain d4-2]